MIWVNWNSVPAISPFFPTHTSSIRTCRTTTNIPPERLRPRKLGLPLRLQPKRHRRPRRRCRRLPRRHPGHPFQAGRSPCLCRRRRRRARPRPEPQHPYSRLFGLLLCHFAAPRLHNRQSHLGQHGSQPRRRRPGCYPRLQCHLQGTCLDPLAVPGAYGYQADPRDVAALAGADSRSVAPGGCREPGLHQDVDGLQRPRREARRRAAHGRGG